MRKSIIGIVWFFVINYTFGQNGTIRGKVIDTDSKEALIGVNIIVDNKTGTITDANGKYNLSLKPGDYKITYKYIGYSTNIMEIDIAEGEVRTMDISMKVEVQAIDEIVVSAGKFEQKLSDVTVSLEVIKPARIESMNTTTLDKAINQIPGVDVMAEQPSIRGGSGYSYGAGSRVLILVDDLPILSPSSGDPKWTFMPLENISQIEVLKGASSSLFGSSALNGVINIRTAFPGNKPETKIISSTGIYMNPERQSLVWKKSEPLLFTATNFTHSRKIGNLDIVVGGEVFGDAGYREHEYENHVRLNANVRYRDKKIEGLSYGCNTNYMYLSRGEFFLWVHADSAYRQNPSALSKTDGSRVNIDPFVTYFDKKGDRFSLRTRFYHENYKNLDEAKNNLADMYYGDFQYQKNIKDKFNLTAGISTQYSEVKANLFGNHYSSCIGFYSQVDKKIKKLSLSAGFRFEYCQVDSTQTVSQFELKNKGKMLMEFPIYPVFRTGLNYQLAQYTFLRGSYGQGYRFPSIAEMYTTASIGGLNIFPNNTLKPETGESAELGIKQGVKISNWSGYIDVAGFYTKYRNMMEFTFGTYKPDSVQIFTLLQLLKYLGFKSINIGNAEITGVDVTFTGQGKFFGLPATLLIGYTYTNPIDLNAANDTSKTENKNILKYRYYHSVKGDFDVSYKKIYMGLSFLYGSFMINIDKAFEEPVIPSSNIYILPGLKEYRQKHNKGTFVFDLRFAYEISEKSKISLVCKNVFNKEYMGRPGDIRPPRSVSLQYTLKF